MSLPFDDFHSSTAIFRASLETFMSLGAALGASGLGLPLFGSVPKKSSCAPRWHQGRPGKRKQLTQLTKFLGGHMHERVTCVAVPKFGALLSIAVVANPERCQTSFSGQSGPHVRGCQRVGAPTFQCREVRGSSRTPSAVSLWQESLSSSTFC